MQKWEGKAYIIAGQKGFSPYLELDLDQAESFLAAHGQRVLLSFKGGGATTAHCKRGKTVTPLLF